VKRDLTPGPSPTRRGEQDLTEQIFDSSSYSPLSYGRGGPGR